MRLRLQTFGAVKVRSFRRFFPLFLILICALPSVSFAAYFGNASRGAVDPSAATQASVAATRAIALYIMALAALEDNNRIEAIANLKSSSELLFEADMLIEKWENSLRKIYKANPPVKILGELERTNTILRDLLNDSFETIYTDSTEVANEMIQYLKNFDSKKIDIIKIYKGNATLFDKFGITRQLKKSLGRIVYLRNGIYLVIEHTEALHVIDVNSGSAQYKNETPEQNAFRVNLIAAEEIARQIRLRDMGGIIIIDFVDMYNNEYKKIIYEKFKEFLSKDRAKYNILPLSKFNIMEMTRQRIRSETNPNIEEICPLCLGTGKTSDSFVIIDNIEDTIKNITNSLKFKKIKIITHPFIASYLNQGIISTKLKWCFKYKCYFEILPDSNFSLNKFKILISNKEIKLNDYETNEN
ncbi:MAG: ribonuclease E/G [Candidatus Jordarchaeaceae archaeon]